jgi:Cu+-exporting ATPase
MAAADFSYLDLGEFRDLYTNKEDSQPTMNFYVNGIRCSNCLKKIESVKNELSGVADVRVNMTNHQAQVILKNTEASFAEFANKIIDKGFQVTPLKKTDSVHEHIKKEFKNDLLRLGVAGFCASNIMMFSFATYLGAAREFAVLFNWLSFALYLPVLTFVTWPFYRGFCQSLLNKQLSIDGPLAIASLTGFLFSFLNLIRDSGVATSIYFDSLAGFLFLITLSRFIQKRLQNYFLNFDLRASEDVLNRARVKKGSKYQWLPTFKVETSDVVKVNQEDILPVDGVLLSSQALLDNRFMTGESRPVLVHKGMKIWAGSRVLSKEIEVQVSQVGSATQWGRWIEKVNSENLSKGKIQNQADIYSKRLLFIVFALAILTFLFFMFTDPNEGFERALALLIVACPCAMAFGTPLALSFSLKKSFAKGFLIKSADVFEKILNCKNIIFDKTGTLTEDRVRILSIEPAQPPLEYLSMALALESVSYHPIAVGLREYLSEKMSGDLTEFAQLKVEIKDIQELAGVGVAGFYEGMKVELKSSSELTGQKSFSLFVNGIRKVDFYYDDLATPSAKKVIQFFKEKTSNIYLLSGDHLTYVEKLAQQLEIKNYKHSQTPEMKSQFVESLGSTLMVGDGVNDSLAFQKASVGIAVNGSAELAMRSADVYLMTGQIDKIQDLYQISESAIRLIQRNIRISLVYNLITGAMAIFGFMNPFLAAVLMPVSSGFILLSSWWGSRK